MTTTITPNPQAWLVKETTFLGSFVVRLNGDRLCSAIEIGAGDVGNA